VSRPHDIEAIISGVRSALPNVEVVQLNQTHPADDDGLWWFRLSGVERDIQLESSSYDCPFLVEHDGMKATSDAFVAQSNSQPIDAVVSYLRSVPGDSP